MDKQFNSLSSSDKEAFARRVLDRFPVPPASSGSHRNPKSDPNQTLFKRSRICQFCADGPGELQCAGCKATRYCSKECQKKDWKFHKDLCKRTREIHAEDVGREDKTQQLRKFTFKHTPVITRSATRALRIWEDPSRCLRDIILVTLRRRSGPCRIETQFFVMDVEVVSLEDPLLAPLIRQAVRGDAEASKERCRVGGAIGEIYVALMCIDDMCLNLAPVMFGSTVMETGGRAPQTEIDN